MSSRFSHVTAYAASNKGLVRPNNEDAFLVLQEAGFFAVADGMGGGEDGEIASQMVTDQLASTMGTTSTESPGGRTYRMSQALQEVNVSIRGYAKQHGFKSMGSTIVAFLLDPWSPEKAMVCHVGDSRAYCFRNGELFQITTDHTIGESLKKLHVEKSVLGNVLMRAIGVNRVLEPEWTEVALCPNDIFVLCSDGLSSMIGIESIASILLENKLTPEKMVEQLIASALESGGKDNVTVVVIRIAERLPPREVIDELDQKESDYLMERIERKG